MNEVIYYPTFEVCNSRWLNFALLYLDKLDPIIPEAGDPKLSDQFRYVQNETDLFEVHRPSYEEGDAATRDTLDHVEKILQHPERYKSLFQQPDFLAKWRSPEKQTAQLFQNKYTELWEHFCVRNGLGRKTSEGLLVNKDLCDVYMTLLAHVIADARGVSPMTDDRTLDRFAVFTRRSQSPEAAAIQTAQAVIDLQIPADLGQIPVASVIRHRNQPAFKKRQHAFHKQLNSFMTAAEQGADVDDFSDALGSAWSDFKDDILRVGTGAVSFGLGVWLLINSASVEPLKAAGQIAGGASLAVGSTLAIRNTWRNIETKRWTRKYLADLGKLKE